MVVDDSVFGLRVADPEGFYAGLQCDDIGSKVLLLTPLLIDFCEWRSNILELRSIETLTELESLVASSCDGYTDLSDKAMGDVMFVGPSPAITSKGS
jgi:hypothetical protein